MRNNIYIYVAVMAGTTYLIRVLPLVLLKKEIKSKFIKSFLFYVPYVCLAAMTFPAIIQEPDKPAAGACAFLVAVLLSLAKKSMIVVALAACLAVYIVESFL